MFHSIGGGTGSGFGALLLSKLRIEYPVAMISTYSVFPDRQPFSTVEPINFVLSTDYQIDDVDNVVVLNN